MRPSSSSRTDTPSSGRPSYTHPPHVSVMPYVVTHRDAGRAGAAQQVRRGRGAAQQHGVEGAQGVGRSGVVEEPHQLGGDERGVPRTAGGHRVDRRDEGRCPERTGCQHGRRRCRPAPSGRAPAGPATWSVGSASSQCPGPASRSCVAAADARSAVGGEQHAAGFARGARGPHDDRDVVAHRRRPSPPDPGATAGPAPDRAAASAGRSRSGRAGTSRRGRITRSA